MILGRIICREFHSEKIVRNLMCYRESFPSALALIEQELINYYCVFFEDDGFLLPVSADLQWLNAISKETNFVFIVFDNAFVYDIEFQIIFGETFDVHTKRIAWELIVIITNIRLIILLLSDGYNIPL